MGRGAVAALATGQLVLDQLLAGHSLWRKSSWIVWMLLVGWELVVVANCCCWLLMLVAAVNCCCWLLLLVAFAGCCCWLPLLVDCCWLLLLVAAAQKVFEYFRNIVDNLRLWPICRQKSLWIFSGVDEKSLNIFWLLVKSLWIFPEHWWERSGRGVRLGEEGWKANEYCGCAPVIYTQ